MPRRKEKTKVIKSSYNIVILRKCQRPKNLLPNMVEEILHCAQNDIF